MKHLAFLFPALLFCFLFTGCIARSKYVDENSDLIKGNSKNIVLLAKQVNKVDDTDETKALLSAAKKDFDLALKHSQESSALVNKDMIDLAVKKIAGKAAGVLGLPTGVGEGIGGGIMMLLTTLFFGEKAKRKKAVKLGFEAAEEDPKVGLKIMKSL